MTDPQITGDLWRTPTGPGRLARPSAGARGVQARGPRWRRTSNGFYVPSTTDPSVPEQRILEQSVRLPDGGAVTGWAACRLAGAAYFDGRLEDNATEVPVQLAVPLDSKLRSVPGSVVTREPFAHHELRRMQDVMVTYPVRATFDEIRRGYDVRAAVVGLDMMAAAVLVSLNQMQGFLEGHRRWRLATRVAWALTLASERSLSPGESRMRLVWVLDDRLPAPLVNQPVFDRRGRLLGVADLFDPASGLVGEYDGATHRGAHRQVADLAREERYRTAGCEFVRATGIDLGRRPDLVERMLNARGRAVRLLGRHTSWTLEAPPGWEPAETAEEQLARRDGWWSRGVPA